MIVEVRSRKRFKQNAMDWEKSYAKIRDKKISAKTSD